MLHALPLLWALNARAQTDSGLDRLFDRAGAHPAAASVPAAEAAALPGPAAAPPAQAPKTARKAGPQPLAPGEAEQLGFDLESISRRLLASPNGNPRREDLHELLERISKLADEDKVRFVQSLGDPAGIVVPLALSRVPHSFEAHMMADRLSRLLKEHAQTLSGWLAEEGAERWSGLLYLRLSAYDRLASYVRPNPPEARPVLEKVFAGVGSVQDNAPAIEALMEQLTAKDRKAALGEELAQGALAALDSLPKDRAQQLALLLMLYKDRFGAYKDAVTAKASALVPEGSYLAANDEPRYDLWPADAFKAAFHFADAKDFQRCLAYFQKRGYAASAQDESGVTLTKTIQGRQVTLAWKLYNSDDDGFMDRAEQAKFQDAVRADLKNPELQGVFLRSHPDFSYTRMFRHGADAGKLFFDGSCRGIWAFARLERYCPDCMLIGNVGGGNPNINDGASYELIEGLSRFEPLAGLQARLRRTGQLSRFLGPWDPPYSKALRRLKP